MHKPGLRTSREPNSPSSSSSLRRWQFPFTSLAAVLLPLTVPGQEAIRTSLAGEEAAAARQAAELDPGFYNLRLGPTKWNLQTDLNIEANDNILLESSSPESDLIFRPELCSRMHWALTEANRIGFEMNAGYSAYVQHSTLDRFFITPGSAVSFDLYVGDLWFNVHDRLSITENSYQDPTVVGVGNYSQFQNDAGLTTTWDLNKMVLKLSFDHLNYSLISGPSDLPDGRSEVFYFSAGCNLSPVVVTGIELGGSLLHYNGGTSPFQNAAEANAGGFVDVQISEYGHLHANGGYTVYSPQASSSQSSPSDFTGAYGQLAWTHRVNRFLDYSLSGGRTINFALFGGTVDLATALLQINFTVVRGLNLSTFLLYEHGSQLFSTSETFNRYGPGVSLGTRLTENLSGSLRFQFYGRDSNLNSGDYSLNLLTLGFQYQL